MREIRYRAWNKQENRWATHNEQLSDVNVSASVRAPSIMTVGSDKYDLQMFTGLKDKNGVEIYEGDLLKKRNYKDAIYKVVWTKHGFELRHDFIRKYKGDSWEETAYLPIHERDYIVIGNIYEHPHLLEVSE